MSKRVGRRLERLLERFTPGYCVNCDAPVVGGKPRLYCGDLCDQIARTVRYVRRCIADGRWTQDDVRAAIRTRMAMILGGGYPATARRLTVAQRLAVMERDGHRCRQCGAPATEVDHIADSSDDLANLQSLCHECHARKTALGFRPAEDAELELAHAIEQRWQVRTPMRLCDDEKAWDAIWPALFVRTRAAFVYEDADGPGYGEGLPKDMEELEHAHYLQDLAARGD
jgi:5-methylcytosine-specific restriction endonuclease McrA